MTIDINIVTFNRLEYLKKCVWSIIAGTSGKYRINIIDDMSTDGTQEWCTQMVERNLVTLFVPRKDKGGTVDNFNYINNVSQSHRFVMCNDDIWFHRGWREECERIFSEHDDCGIVSFFNYRRFNLDANVEFLEDGKTIRCTRTGLAASMHDRESWDNAGGFVMPQGGKMGFFATPYCWNIFAPRAGKRNKIYSTVAPHPATHMDEKICGLREHYEEYNHFRSTQKNPNKHRKQ